MPEADSPLQAPVARRHLWPERKRWRFVIGASLILVALLLYGWLTREQIARDIISSELERLGIEATYSINSIGPGEQVLTDLVVGDPARPDFTADRVTVELAYGLGPPEIGRIALFNPRLYGTFVDGKLSFGALDKALFAPSDEPPELPSIDLDLHDGRALIQSEFGPIGFKAEGRGNLASGFDGVLAMSAPGLSDEACSLGKLSAYGRIVTQDGLPSFNGPVRLRDLSCDDLGLAAESLDWQLDASGSRDFSAFDGGGAFAIRSLEVSGIGASSLDGSTQLSWSKQGLRSRFEAAANEVSNTGIRLASARFEGGLRAGSDFAQVDADLDLAGEGVSLGAAPREALSGLHSGPSLPIVTPLLIKLGRALERTADGNQLIANIGLRQSSDQASVIVPQAHLRSRDGITLASLSRVQLQFSGDSGVPRIEGNAVISGPDLPQLRARMEQNVGGKRVMRIAMQPYASEGNEIGLPEFMLVQNEDGSFGFSGRVRASGELGEGGRVEALTIPVTGRWSADGGLALWQRCSALAARSLSVAGMSFTAPRLEVCPRSGTGIRLANGKTRFDLAARLVRLTGRMGDERAALTAGAITANSASGLRANNLEFVLGEGPETTRIALASVSGSLGDNLAGQFTGAQVALAAVPLDISDGAGAWRIVDGALLLSEGALTVTDRKADPRFEPLIARDADLVFEDSVILAQGTLREPFTGREVTKVTLRHDLSSGEGNARLSIESLLFDEQLQPAAGSDVCLNRGANGPDFRPQTPGLSCLALGIVANVKGSVTGEGWIDWDPQEVTSGGTFTTQDADLAAAFGPLEGVSGTVVFTDLLNLTTAPNQVFKIRNINPGVEVVDGEVAFNLRDGQVLEIERGRWPFMGGELALEPAVLDFREPMDRRYVLLIDGLDAAKFVQYMDLGNISATGIFDGSVPIVFDTDGNGRIERGLLRSRPPGGNVSYIGELTYEDLGAMANFAFQSLRSLDFTQMEVEMEGPLTGEIITRLKFDGVRQGEGASSNIVTRRIAKLPIQFRVNIRADFYSLLNNVRSMYDPAFVRDPRELGLLSSDGARFVVPEKPVPPASPIPDQPAIKPEEPGNPDTSDEPAIQGQESETLP